MVQLTKIYTRTGDEGRTSLGDGKRVSKTSPRVAAYGAVDELNTALGLVLAQGLGGEETDLLRRIQNELFDLGADLCVPQPADEAPGARLRMTPEHVKHLESEIDRLNARLQPLRSFILPGGAPAAAWLHQARVVCRRAERDTVALAEQEPINAAALKYLNRLSDLLFVMARVANGDGQADVLWQPGQTLGHGSHATAHSVTGPRTPGS